MAGVGGRRVSERLENKFQSKCAADLAELAQPPPPPPPPLAPGAAPTCNIIYPNPEVPKGQQRPWKQALPSDEVRLSNKAAAALPPTLPARAASSEHGNTPAKRWMKSRAAARRQLTAAACLVSTAQLASTG